VATHRIIWSHVLHRVQPLNIEEAFAVHASSIPEKERLPFSEKPEMSFHEKEPLHIPEKQPAKELP